MKTRSLYTLDNLMRKRDFPFQINLKGLQFFLKKYFLGKFTYALCYLYIFFTYFSSS